MIKLLYLTRRYNPNRYYYSESESAMVIKVYSAFPKLKDESLTIRWFSVIYRTFIEDVLLSTEKHSVHCDVVTSPVARALFIVHNAYFVAPVVPLHMPIKVHKTRNGVTKEKVKEKSNQSSRTRKKYCKRQRNWGSICCSLFSLQLTSHT